MVMATQNPIEYEGTFPLPEAQLDRFLLRIRLGYPDREDEIEIIDRQQRTHPIDTISQVATAEELLEIQSKVRDVTLVPPLRGYIVDIVAATRAHRDVYLGASPRGSLGLFRASQARALLNGREYVIPDDIKALAEFVLPHRIIVTPSARVKNIDSTAVVREILESLPVPSSRVRLGVG